MPYEKPSALDAPAELAKRITEVLLQERVVPRFVDSYVVETAVMRCRFTLRFIAIF